MEKTSSLEELVKYALSGFALSKAVIEDYAKHVAKLENVQEQEVKDRIKNRADEIFKEMVQKLAKPTEEETHS